MSTNYYNTLIQIADDSPTESSVTPDLTKQSVASQQFKMIYDNPLQHTSDDVIFARVADKEGIAAEDISREREEYFKKGRACLRTSPLAKQYGWGIYADNEGKLELVAAESDAYQALVEDDGIKKVKAMRRSRA